MGYIAGPAPNMWGYYHNGDTVANVLQQLELNPVMNTVKNVLGDNEIKSSAAVENDDSEHSVDEVASSSSSSTINDYALRKKRYSFSSSSSSGSSYKNHSLFGRAALLIMQEVCVYCVFVCYLIYLISYCYCNSNRLPTADCLQLCGRSVN